MLVNLYHDHDYHPLCELLNGYIEILVLTDSFGEGPQDLHALSCKEAGQRDELQCLGHYVDLLCM